MMAPHRTVTALIPAFNEADSIERTIVSIRNQTYPIAEIIVIDDCSTDRTGELAARLGVTVLRTDRNQGAKARAQSYALPFVKTELFLTVDADTILAPDALELTIPSFDDDRVCCACGMVIPQNIHAVWERARFIEYLHGYEIVKSAQDAIHRVLVAPGCFTVFRTSLVVAFGGFDTRTMAEDMDLTWNLLESGYRVAVVPEARCYPIEPSTFRVYVRQLDRWYRGFLQNIKVRHFNLFSKDPVFGLMVYYYVVAGFIAPISIPMLLWAVVGSRAAALWIIPVGALAVHVLLTWIPALLKARDLEMTSTALASLPASLFVPFVNMVVYVRSVWREWVVQDKLHQWQKGH
jgi:biofilm PGA synthesis N-glycosyltransferase PgaC